MRGGWGEAESPEESSGVSLRFRFAAAMDEADVNEGFFLRVVACGVEGPAWMCVERRRGRGVGWIHTASDVGRGATA